MIRRLASAAIMERQEPQATLLRLRLIGSIEAADSSGCDVLPSSRKSRALLSYLALNADQWVPRSRITRLLWDRVPEEQGRASLRQALHELSRAMGPMFAMIMETERERVRLRSEAVWIDALVVATPAGSVPVDELPDLNVFSGSLLLDGLDGLSNEFDHWLTLERQKLEERIRRRNEASVRSNIQDLQPHQDRVEIARKAAAVDPTNEEAVRELMRALADTGQRAQAMLEYERCRAVLRSRLDIEPAPETQRLCRDLRRQPSLEDPVAQDKTPSIGALSLRLSETQASPASQTLGGYDARPSIAVLPFREDAAGPDQTYFGDGFVDNIIHGLAGLKELIVISRGSTMGYARRPVDVRTIGRELTVQYVLTGSVQRSADKLRIGTVLAETEGGTVIRANRYDGQLGDMFALQDQISEGVAKTIAPSVRERELKRALKKHPQNMTAYDLVLQALEPLYQLDYASFARAQGLLQRAMTIDPSYAPAFANAARWHSLSIGQEWSQDVAADAREAVRLARAGIACDHNDALAWAIYGHQMSRMMKDFPDAIQSFDRAISACPNLALAWTYSGATACFIGDGPGAVMRAETGLRLSPLDAHVFFAEHILAQAHYVNGDNEKCVAWATRSDKHNPRLTSNLRTLAAGLVAVGREDEAREVARRHSAIVPTFSLAAWAARTPMNDRLKADRIERLRLAGMPD